MDAPRTSKDFAKTLRRRLSLPEVILWNAVKARKLDGLHFRKQHPIGPYVLDFYCHELRLAVELDGAGHSMGDAPAKDAARDAWLAANGIRTLRMSAALVLEDVDNALDTIRVWARGEEGG